MLGTVPKAGLETWLHHLLTANWKALGKLINTSKPQFTSCEDEDENQQKAAEHYMK